MSDDSGADSEHVRGCLDEHVRVVFQKGIEVTAKWVLQIRANM